MNRTPDRERASADQLHDDVTAALAEMQEVANHLGFGSSRAPHLLIDGVPIRDLSTRAHHALTAGWNALTAHLERTAYRRADMGPNVLVCPACSGDGEMGQGGTFPETCPVCGGTGKAK